MKFNFQSQLWLYQGKGAWFFITLPPEESLRIKLVTVSQRKGWGAVRVSATIGKTTWQTSIFPYAKAAAYILPVKADIRKKEKITAGDIVIVKIKLEI